VVPAVGGPWGWERTVNSPWPGSTASACRGCGTVTSTTRTAGCGPACPVVWEGTDGGDVVSPYPDRPFIVGWKVHTTRVLKKLSRSGVTLTDVVFTLAGSAGIRRQPRGYSHRGSAQAAAPARLNLRLLPFSACSFVQCDSQRCAVGWLLPKQDQSSRAPIGLRSGGSPLKP